MTDEEKRARVSASNKRYRTRHAAKCAAYAKAYREAHKKPRAQEPTSKSCKRCGITKDRSAFFKRNKVTGARQTRGALGVDNLCKACRSEIRKPGLASERAERSRLSAAGLKRCNVCNNTLTSDRFAARRASTDGLCHTCRECAKKRCAEWKRSNPGAFSQWAQRNAEHRAEYGMKWRNYRIEYRRNAYRDWALKNKGRVVANVRHRELTKLRATPIWSTRASMRAFYVEAARLSNETGVAHEVDHIVPLRHAKVCGLHVAANLQVITRAANKSKGNKHYITHPCMTALVLTQPCSLSGSNRKCLDESDSASEPELVDAAGAADVGFENGLS